MNRRFWIGMDLGLTLFAFYPFLYELRPYRGCHWLLFFFFFHSLFSSLVSVWVSDWGPYSSNAYKKKHTENIFNIVLSVNSLFNYINDFNGFFFLSLLLSSRFSPVCTVFFSSLLFSKHLTRKKKHRTISNVHFDSWTKRVYRN